MNIKVIVPLEKPWLHVENIKWCLYSTRGRKKNCILQFHL